MNKEIKLCVDCSRCESNVNCQARYKSVVDGREYGLRCCVARASELYCGAEARYFEPKEDAAKIEEPAVLDDELKKSLEYIEKSSCTIGCSPAKCAVANKYDYGQGECCGCVVVVGDKRRIAHQLAHRDQYIAEAARLKEEREDEANQAKEREDEAD